MTATDTYVCTKCGETKPIDGFYMDRRKGKQPRRAARCKVCHIVETNRWGKANREKRLDIQRRSEKKRGTAARQTVLDHYGRVCVCCDETIEMFLCIDHVNNDGGEHRKEVRPGPPLYYWLIRNDFPTDFQILCYNCNNGKRLNAGVCPHQTI